MRAFSILVGLVGIALAGCEEQPAAPAGPDPTAAQQALRQAREAAEKELNPKGLPVYSGAVGGVRGVVHVSGDAAPLVPDMVKILPPNACPRAHELHRHLFREGAGRTLADVLVTVTEYQGYLPARGDAQRVEAKGCAFDARILAMTFGQHLEVYNLDSQGYMPRLAGTNTLALRVAMPGGAPVPVFAPQPGRYILVEQTRDYMRSDLFVLGYPTFAVTGVDGKYQVDGVPVGNVKVTAYAPAFGQVLEKRVEIQAGAVAEVAFDLDFSESAYVAGMKEGDRQAPEPPRPPASQPAAPPAPQAVPH